MARQGGPSTASTGEVKVQHNQRLVIGVASEPYITVR